MKSEMCVPASALAAGDDGQDMSTPGVGDEVDFSGKGKVTRVEGDNVYLTPTEINGEPLDEQKDMEPPADDDESSMDQMIGQQLAADGGY